MTDQELLALTEGLGFDHFALMDPATLEFLPAVRDMCAADRCRSYGRCWVCPPHCGTLEELSARAAGYKRGILLQSTGQMEDDYDVDTMMETEQLQKQRFRALEEEIRKRDPRCMPMSAGPCELCPSCACPDGSCRFPDRAVPSMEACGLLVSQVCEDAGLKYYYGPRTITFSSCILFD